MKKLIIIFLLFAVPVMAEPINDLTDYGDITIESAVTTPLEIRIDGNYVDLHEYIAKYEQRLSLDEKVIKALEVALGIIKGMKWDYMHMSTQDFEWCLKNGDYKSEYIEQTLQEYKEMVGKEIE